MTIHIIGPRTGEQRPGREDGGTKMFKQASGRREEKT
jgi:hypothetical protein